jgi:hypothetical protein
MGIIVKPPAAAVKERGLQAVRVGEPPARVPPWLEPLIGQARPVFDDQL